MTADEQEALSRRHDRAARIILLPLSSGAVAIFNGEMDLCDIALGDLLEGGDGVTISEVKAHWKPPAAREARPQPTLEDLGL